MPKLKLLKKSRKNNQLLLKSLNNLDYNSSIQELYKENPNAFLNILISMLSSQLILYLDPKDLSKLAMTCTTLNSLIKNDPFIRNIFNTSPMKIDYFNFLLNQYDRKIHFTPWVERHPTFNKTATVLLAVLLTLVAFGIFIIPLATGLSNHVYKQLTDESNIFWKILIGGGAFCLCPLLCSICGTAVITTPFSLTAAGLKKYRKIRYADDREYFKTIKDTPEERINNLTWDQITTFFHKPRDQQRHNEIIDEELGEQLPLLP